MQNQECSTPARPQPDKCFSATRGTNFAVILKQLQQKQTTTTIRTYQDLAGQITKILTR